MQPVTDKERQIMQSEINALTIELAEARARAIAAQAERDEAVEILGQLADVVLRITAARELIDPELIDRARAIVARHDAVDETALARQEIAPSSVVPACCWNCRWGFIGSLSCDKFHCRPVGLFCGAWRDMDDADVVSEEEEEE